MAGLFMEFGRNQRQREAKVQPRGGAQRDHRAGLQQVPSDPKTNLLQGSGHLPRMSRQRLPRSWLMREGSRQSVPTLAYY